MSHFERKLSSITLYTADLWESACPVVRVVEPAKLAGLQVIQGNEFEAVSVDSVSRADIVIIQRDFPRYREAYDQIIDRARAETKPVVYELDDLLLDLPDEHPAQASRYFRDALIPMMRAIAEADAVTASTPALCAYLRSFNDNTWLLPNYLNDRLWTIRARANTEAGTSVVIGYMGGGTHQPDLELVTLPLLKILRKYRRDVVLKFWGGEPPPALLHQTNVEWIPLSLLHYEEFAAYFSNQVCDVFIAPLRDNVFNRHKSPIKYLEYSALGVPGVYSRLGPYDNIVIHGQNGLLASTPEEWEACLVQLIEDSPRRAQMGREAQDTVSREWLLSKNAYCWLETYQKILSSVVKPRQSEGIQLARRMQRLHYELVATMEQDVRTTADTAKELDAQVWALKARVADKEQAMAAITSGISWQLMMATWKAIARLAPHKSRRERFLRRVVTALWRNGKALVQWSRRMSPAMSLARRQPTRTTAQQKQPLTLTPSLVVDTAPRVSPPLFESARLLTTRRFRVLYISSAPDLHSHRYRVNNFREYLASVGVHADVMLYDRLASHLFKIPTYDIVVVFRTIYDELFGRVHAICQKAGVPIVYDIDDYIFDTSIVTEEFVDGLRFISPASRAAYAQAVPRYRQALLASDYCSTPTPFLAEKCRELGKTAFVLPNGLNAAVFRLSQEAQRSKNTDDGKIRIGYFSGTKTHQRDFAVVAEALAKLMLEYLQVELVVVGELELDEFPALIPLRDRIEARPRVGWEQLPSEMARVDINIVPLEINNPYCEAKSELKYFEAAAVKVPTVASATHTFQNVIRDGKTGFLAGNSESWHEALRTLILDRQLRQEIAARAYEQAAQAYQPVTLGVTARSAYSSVLRAHRKRLMVSDTALSVAFVLPPFLRGSGGHNKTMSIAHGLAQRGHEIRLYVDGAGSDIDTSFKILQESGHLGYAKFSGSLSDLVSCDALIATYWRTAYSVKTFEGFCARAFYFVQDYEPYFYPMGEQYLRADHSYDLGLFVIAYGSWCLQEAKRRHRCDGDWIPYFIDRRLYDASPSNWPERRKLLFFARPEMERRCYKMGIEALTLLSQHMNLAEAGVEIVLFGSDRALPNVPFAHTHLGVLTPPELARLYSTGRIGLVPSTTNMSMVSYEMMACGCPIVDFDINDNAALYGGRDNALLVDPEPGRMAYVLANALAHPEDARQVAERAYKFAKGLSSEADAVEAFERILYREIQQLRDSEATK